MTSRPAAVRNVRHRALGSGTRFRDEVSVPMSLYHGSRVAAWAFRDRTRGLLLALFLVLWMAGGSFALAVVGWCVLVALGLTGWLWWRSRLAGGEPLSLREAIVEARRKRTLHRRWALACRTAGLLGPETGRPPALRRLRGNGRGSLTAHVRSGAIGVPVPSITKTVVTLSEVIGCREVVVQQESPGVAVLSFHWTDPIRRTLPLSDLPPAPAGRLAYGIRQDGTVASIKATQSVLIGGLTRKGKSNVVWAMLADALRQEIPIHLYVSDPKGGVELDALEAMVGAEVGLLKVRQYAKTPAETVKMLEAADKAMRARQRDMKEKGTRQVQPDRDNPLVVVILDETLPLADILRKGADSPLGRIGYTGAAAGYVVWANTQVAQVDTIGRFRDLIPQRICFATPNPQVTDSVLGQGAEASGAKCSEIEAAGVGFSYIEGDKQARKFRAALVTDDQVRAIGVGRLPKEVTDRYQLHLDREAEDGVREQRSRACALYRWWGADDPDGSPPAYIGISYDVLVREAQHSAALREFMAGDVRRTVEWFPTRKAALEAEKAAIQAERPRYNVVHNRRVKVELPSSVRRREREVAGR